jgi:hypothetical protein
MASHNESKVLLYAIIIFVFVLRNITYALFKNYLSITTISLTTLK